MIVRSPTMPTAQSTGAHSQKKDDGLKKIYYKLIFFKIVQPHFVIWLSKELQIKIEAIWFFHFETPIC